MFSVQVNLLNALRYHSIITNGLGMGVSKNQVLKAAHPIRLWQMGFIFAACISKKFTIKGKPAFLKTTF
jgi:hypothetical protein